MLTEGEKEARRSEYKSKQVVPKVRGGSCCAAQSSGAPGRGYGRDATNHFDAAAAAATAVGMVVATQNSTEAGVALATQRPLCSDPLATELVQASSWVPPLTIQALKNHSDATENERVVKLEGISPGEACCWLLSQSAATSDPSCWHAAL